SYVWLSPATLFEHQPTMRFDYNVTSANRVSGSFSFITAKRTADYLNNADARFPGSPNVRDFVSTRPLMSLSPGSAISNQIQNGSTGGLAALYGFSNFGYTSAIAPRNSPAAFADEGGFAITTPTSTTDWFTSNGPSWRAAPNANLDESLTWLHG